MALTKATYALINGAAVNVLDYGAKGDGITDDAAAIQAALIAGTGAAVYFPKGNYKLTQYVAIPNNTYVYGDGVGSRLFADGTIGEIFRTPYPASNITIDNLCLDGGKTAGTGPVVVCVYSPAALDTPNVYNKYITVKNCTIKNANAGIGIENGMFISVENNTIASMFYQLAGNPGAGNYGYGVVLNGCTRSQVINNYIGISGGLIERHGIYLPVFRDANVNPSVLNFAAEIVISNNVVMVNRLIDPFSSCIESFNYYDFIITNNLLMGGVRGINSSPEYQNGSRVLIANNIIKDNEICIRNGPATYTTNKYFEEYTIVGNELMPLTSVAHQCVKLQGVKNIVFANNYCRGDASSTFAFGYFDTVENITADSIQAVNNRITGFTQGYYLANVTMFSDTKSVFSNFTSGTLPYVRVTAISYSEMTPLSTPYVDYYSNGNGDWSGVKYFSVALGKEIYYNGSFWQDAMGIRVRGTTANRPNTTGLPYGFKYFDTTVGNIVTWDGSNWT